MDKLEQLLDALREEGYEADLLEEQLRINIPLGLSSFKIRYELQFGDELMRYVLVFAKPTTGADLNYELTELTATHRDPVDIDHKVYGGVDTSELDADMEMVDWQSYFYARQEFKHPVHDELSGDIIRRLVTLSNTGDPEALFAQQLLMYKHWPRDGFEIYRKEGFPDLPKAHEHTYTFRKANGDSLNPVMAYMIISERYDYLIGVLESLRIYERSMPELQRQLVASLKKHAEPFELKGSCNLDTGSAEFTIPVASDQGRYLVDQYQVSMAVYPAIPAGQFNGVDARHLDRAMQEINWKNDDALFHFHEDFEPEFKGNIGDIRDQLQLLAQDPSGIEVADLLQLKYLQDVTLFGDEIPDSAWKLLEGLPKASFTFPIEIPLPAAINLLQGRPVFDELATIRDGATDQWLSLDLASKNEAARLIKINGYSRKQMEGHLDLVPIPNYNFYAVLDRLLLGDRVKVVLKDESTILIEADPRQSSINIFAVSGDQIPFNFNLDPNWKPQPPAPDLGRGIDMVVRRTKMKDKHKRGKGI